MRKSSIKFIGLIFLIPILLGCDSTSVTNESLVKTEAEASSVVANIPKISDKALEEIIESIPSSIEISMLIKKSGGTYDKKILNSESNYSKYNSSFKKALNLGIYSTDLGYTNIYNQNADAMLYLNSIKNLADELNIGQFYDYNTIKRLASNSKNMDSLMLISTMNFEKINDFLYQQKRTDHCILILVGGWLEALNIACEVAKKSSNQDVIEKIAEQKIVLDQLLLLVSNYKEQVNMEFVYNELNKLKEIYNKVTITYEYHEPKMEELDGVLMIVDETESKINMTKDQFNSIVSIVSNMRSKIIS